MSELVSIIIPCFNSSAILREALDCACQQTHRELDIIVVDGGSTDASYELAERYPDSRVRLVRRAHRGACAARNIGLAVAQGKYLQFLDANDVLHPDKIALQVEALEQSEDSSAIAYGPWWSFLKHASFLRGANFVTGRSYRPPMEWLFASMAEGFYSPSHCWLIPRAVADSAGQWDERLIQNQDGEYFSRVLEVATQVIWVPTAQAFYRQENALSSSQSHETVDTHSLLLAADQIRDRMIAYLGYEPKRRRVISALYLRILYSMDGSDLELVNQVWRRIYGLGLPDGGTKVGSLSFDLLKRHMGWELAFKMKQLVRI
ncbi:MAG: glycosyltransferase involved in cell wall biosynthesis [Lentimonas sp.]|jgi:glycosyltransferase involved in cell wall biosynthesis